MSGPREPKRNQVVAAIERCDAQPGMPVSDLTAASPGLPGTWHRVPGLSVSGFVNAPLPPLPVPSGGGQLRVVVREVEDIETAMPLDGSLAAELRQRTVFIDVILITAAG